MLTVESLAANAAKLDLVALEILGVLGVRVVEVEGELVRDFSSLDLTTRGLLLLVLGVCEQECEISGMFLRCLTPFFSLYTHTCMQMYTHSHTHNTLTGESTSDSVSGPDT